MCSVSRGILSRIRSFSLLHPANLLFCIRPSPLSTRMMDPDQQSSTPSEAAAEATQTKDRVPPSLPSSLPVVSYVTVPYERTSSSVGFVDVGPREGPVVVALHGAPGGVQDFAELYGPLADRGIRFVVPEFPGYGRTTVKDAKEFDESTVARAKLVSNFLETLNIKSVTSVVGHSMGAATAFHLAANSDNFRSVISLNGIGFQPQGSIRPFWATCLTAYLLENSWTERFVSYFLASAYTLKGYNTDNISAGMATGIVSASRIGFDKHRENISLVKEKRLPIFLAFTKNDRLIEWNLPMDVVKFLETPDENISWLDSDERLVKGRSIDEDGDPVPSSSAVIFDRGGHFVHRSHTSVMVKSISRFAEQVHFATESEL